MKEYDWDNCPKKILKSLMGKYNITQQRLADLLMEQNIKETNKTICNKLSRGKFSAIFFFQCLHAMGVEQFSLDEDFFIKNKWKN